MIKKLALYESSFKNLGIKYNPALLKAVTKGLGPSIYKSDAEKVSGSDVKELETVKKNFLSSKY